MLCTAVVWKMNFRRRMITGRTHLGPQWQLLSLKDCRSGRTWLLFLSRPLCSHDQINHVLALQQHKTRHIPQHELLNINPESWERRGFLHKQLTFHTCLWEPGAVKVTLVRTLLEGRGGASRTLEFLQTWIILYSNMNHDFWVKQFHWYTVWQHPFSP